MGVSGLDHCASLTSLTLTSGQAWTEMVYTGGKFTSAYTPGMILTCTPPSGPHQEGFCSHPPWTANGQNLTPIGDIQSSPAKHYPIFVLSDTTVKANGDTGTISKSGDIHWQNGNVWALMS